MKQKRISVPYYTRMVETLIERVPIYSSGTYNNADPTHYEKGVLTIQIGKQKYVVTTHDCTWGVDVRIHRQVGRQIKTRLVGHIYLNRGMGSKDEVIHRTRHYHVSKLIHTLLKALPKKA